MNGNEESKKFDQSRMLWLRFNLLSLKGLPCLCSPHCVFFRRSHRRVERFLVAIPPAQSFYGTVDQRVKAGVQFLSGINPYWFMRIKPATLDVSSGCDCIVGQLFGGMRNSWERGLDKLGVNVSDGDHCKFGFYVHPEFSLHVENEYWELTQVWKKTIIELQKAEEKKRLEEENDEPSNTALDTRDPERNPHHDDLQETASIETLGLAGWLSGLQGRSLQCMDLERPGHLGLESEQLRIHDAIVGHHV